MFRCLIVFILTANLALSSPSGAATKTCDAPVDATASVGHPDRIIVGVDGNHDGKACSFVVDEVGARDMKKAFLAYDAAYLGNAIADIFGRLPGGSAQTAHLGSQDFTHAVYACYGMAFKMQDQGGFIRLDADFQDLIERGGLSCFVVGGEGAEDLGEFDEALAGYGTFGSGFPELIYSMKKMEGVGTQLVFVPMVPRE